MAPVWLARLVRSVQLVQLARLAVSAGARASAALLALLLGGTAALAAEPLPAERVAACVACHGAGGVSRQAGTPSLAGQPSFYAVTQLFLFREGRRNNVAMNAVAKGMSNDDLRAYADWVAQLPSAAAADPAPLDRARAERGARLAMQHRCTSCHGSDLAGDKQVPRLAGQREDYLQQTLTEFRAGTRIGYTQAMNEALAGLDAAALTDLAHALSHAPTGAIAAPNHPAAAAGSVPR